MSAPATHAGSSDQAAARLLSTVEAVAAELHPREKRHRGVTLDSLLDRDLGFDSLGRVELLARVEKDFETALPERLLVEMDTPRDLLRALLSAGGTRAAAMPAMIRPPALEQAAAAPVELETLTEILDWHSAAHPDRPHLRIHSDEGDGEILTYRGLKDGAERIAAGLQQRDLQPDEAVVIMLPTGRDYFISFFGILLAGGVPAPIYPPLRPSQIEDHLRRHAGIVGNCRARVLITEPEAKPVARLLRARAETLEHVVTPEDLVSGMASGDLARPPRGARDLAFVQYTSGSTGHPKGVSLTHGNLLANIRAMSEALEGGPDDVFVSWLPLYHDMGLIGAWLGSLVSAAHLVIMPPLAFMARPQRWLWAIHRYRATISAAPNFGYELCLRRIADKDLTGLDLSSWRAACNGAEQVSPGTIERFCARFARHGFRREAMMPVYGLAECSVGLAFPPLGRGPVIDRIERETFTTTGRAVPAAEAESGALRFVSSGIPLPGHEIRIVDRAGRELPERQEGRLEFRGPSATGGYLHNPEATARLFHGEWLDSEDLAYFAGGEVYITGRTKDVIIRAGRNVYPEELEEAVGDLDGVQKGNVAVFASPDPVTGTERLVVLAETRKRAADVRERLRVRINQLAADLIGMPPDDIVLAAPRSVLKTSSGKIRRAASREVYERGLLGRPPAALWLQTVRAAAASLLPQLRGALRRLAAMIFAVYAWTLFGLSAPVLWFAVALLPSESSRWATLRGGLRGLARATGTPLSVEGLERLPPDDRHCVFVSNHASYLDSFALVAVLPGRLAFVAKAELDRAWPSRIPLRRVGTEFVERFDKEKGLEDARRVARAAKAGRRPLFFAEGTCDRRTGLLPFHMGAFMAAAEAGLPIVPVTIRGTRSMLRPTSWFPRRGAISVVVSRAIDPAGFAGETAGDTWALALGLREATRAEILRHCREPDLGFERSPI